MHPQQHASFSRTRNRPISLELQARSFELNQEKNGRVHGKKEKTKTRARNQLVQAGGGSDKRKDSLVQLFELLEVPATAKNIVGVCQLQKRQATYLRFRRCASLPHRLRRTPTEESPEACPFLGSILILQSMSAVAFQRNPALGGTDFFSRG